MASSIFLDVHAADFLKLLRDNAATIFEQHSNNNRPCGVAMNTMNPHHHQNNTGGGQQSEVAKDRRRERNRILAKKTRMKNKSMVESLRQELEELRKENDQLKGSLNEIVTTSLTAAATADLCVDAATGEHASVPVISAVGKEILAILENNLGKQSVSAIGTAKATATAVAFAADHQGEDDEEDFDDDEEQEEESDNDNAYVLGCSVEGSDFLFQAELPTKKQKSYRA